MRFYYISLFYIIGTYAKEAIKKSKCLCLVKISRNRKQTVNVRTVNNDIKPILLLDTLKTTDSAPSLTVQGLGDAVGGAQEDQRVLLVLGGHVSVHQHQPAVAPR